MSPPMFKYGKDKKQLLTVHAQCNPMHFVRHKECQVGYFKIYLITAFQ